MRRNYPTLMPCIYPVNDKEWKLYLDWEIEIDVAKVKFQLSVLRGYTSDFASIPRIFWTLIGHPLMGKSIRGSLTHDVLYGKKAFTREICDEIFYEILIKDGVSKVKANILWQCVRAFGWKYYGKNKKSQDLVSLIYKNMNTFSV